MPPLTSRLLCRLMSALQAQEMARQQEQERILKRPEQKKISISLKKSGGPF